MNDLFVYGIFLDQYNRDNYGMYNAQYTTVLDYITVGDRIVEAKYMPNIGASLTGLMVQVDPRYWEELDYLERGYDRIRVVTITGHKVWMYAQKGTVGVDVTTTNQEGVQA